MEKRAVYLFAALILLFCAAAARLLFLFGGGGRALTSGYQRTGYEVTLFRQRGGIYDCNLARLTENQTEYRALIEPAKLSDDSVRLLAQKGIFTPSAADNETGDPRLAYILRQAKGGKPFSMSVKEYLDADGVSVYSFPKRYDGAFAAHVIGYLDGAGKGVLGMEKACDSLLSQETVSKAVFETDAAQRLLANSGYTLSYNINENPDGIVLTIDAGIQRIAEKAADKRIKKGAVLVVESATGRIKAMVSRPAFDPSDVLGKLPDLDDGELLNNTLLAFNAGSAFKIVTAAAALESGFPKSFTMECEGYYDTGSNRLQCYNGTRHGLLDFKNAFAKSCNAFFCEVSAKTGASALYDMAARMGFGRGMTLYEGKAADGSGRIYSAGGNLTNKKDLSAPAALANFTIGQGALLVTPVQMTELINIIATGGFYQKLSLVTGERRGGEVKETFLTTLPERILSHSTAQSIRDYLVYAAREGTGRLAMPKGAEAAVKTSTAEAFEKGQKTRHVWIIGFFPAYSPEYTICVMAVGGDSGEYTAAPVFKEIADGILSLKSEK